MPRQNNIIARLGAADELGQLSFRFGDGNPDNRPSTDQLMQPLFASSLPNMGSYDLPLLDQPSLPTSSCFFVRLTTRRFFVPA